jgi:uncharacterized protein (DUF305 family)
MTYKPILYTLIGLLTGSAATALVLSLTVTPFPQVVQAQPTPSQTSPSAGVTVVPGRWGMMGQSDQRFIIMMIPHHDGAIAMADLALQRSQRSEIRTLAQSIKDTQSHEIEQMRTWYRQWYGTDVPDWGPGNRWGWSDRDQTQPGNNQQPVWGSGMKRAQDWDDSDQQWGPGMMHGGMMGNGWMGTDLYALQSASDFDREFIQQMIPHHQMGVMMAQMVLANSDRPEIRELAQRIIDTQTAEINQMQQWYQDWYH